MIHSHDYYMSLAQKLALKGKGTTLPNPLVGALVVKKGVVVGKGCHKLCGEAHAEVIALNQAGLAAKQATLYVTLEPCAHFGRTPPCVERIIRSGVKEVVVGMIDPNPLNNGKGVGLLRAHGIKVSVGFKEAELKKMNEVFITYITERRPFITVKTGQSLDGKIATRTGDSKWITSDKARVFARRQRRFYDAIMVGVNTIREDNPKLTHLCKGKQPVKIVVDSNLSTPSDANIFAGNSRVIIVTVPIRTGQETENKKILGEKTTILEVKEKDGQINLRDMMKKLAALEISNCLVEGGGTLIGSLFDEGLVDKVMFYISPTIIGGKDAVSSVMGRGVARVEKAFRLKESVFKRLGNDLLVEGYV